MLHTVDIWQRARDQMSRQNLSISGSRESYRSMHRRSVPLGLNVSLPDDLRAARGQTGLEHKGDPVISRPISNGKPTTSRQLPTAGQLLELCDELPPFSIAGFEVSKRKINVHVASVPPDERCGSAGLFGVRAPRSWLGVGIKIGGTARRLDSGQGQGTAVSAVALTRNGEMASYLEIDGERFTEVAPPLTMAEDKGIWVDGIQPDHNSSSDLDNDEVVDIGRPQGVIVDSLHRILGLPSPGPEISTPAMATSLWLNDVLTILFIKGSIDWTEAAMAHPLIGQHPIIPPSVEMVVEATCRASELVNWERLRNNAIAKGDESAGLTPDEMRWMDSTMFSRWIISSFPDPEDVVETMIELGCIETAERVAEVIQEIASRRTRNDADQYDRRIA